VSFKYLIKHVSRCPAAAKRYASWFCYFVWVHGKKSRL